MNNVTVCSHPYLKDALTHLRKTETSSCELRSLVKRATIMIALEALADQPLVQIEIETPVARTTQPVLRHPQPVIVPILRAGVGMLDGMMELIPQARIGLVGMERDEQTHQAHSYYCKLPDSLGEAPVLLIDPMLATGGSAIDCVSLLKDRGAKDIRFLCMVAAPEGLKAFAAAHPDVAVTAGVIDDHLNEDAYIVPGLGDAGDRIFDTINCIR